MSNYVKTTDFAAKDALATGNPNKIARGTEVDAEFDNIAVAIATKEDTGNKGQANGYAELNSSGDVPDSQISQSSVTQHQAALTIVTANITNDNVTNAKLANMASTTVKGQIVGGSGDPVDLTAAQLIDILETADGTGTGLDADTVDGSHASAFAAASHAHAASDITSGTFADARISENSVQQHAFAVIRAHTIQSDPGGTPSGSPGQMFLYY